MNSKVVCFFLILSVVVALTAATFEDDVEQFLFEDMMEKRGRGGRGRGGKKMSYEPCPNNPRCYCLYNHVTGEYGKSAMCGQADAANVGI